VAYKTNGNTQLRQQRALAAQVTVAGGFGFFAATDYSSIEAFEPEL